MIVTRCARNNKRPRTVARLTALAAAVTLLATACGGDETTATEDQATEPTETTTEQPTDETAEEQGPTANHHPADAGFEHTFDAIVAAAANEPPLHDCHGFADDEYEAFLGPFLEQFPDIEMFDQSDCQGAPSRERVYTEWRAGVYDMDVITLPSVDIEMVLEEGMGARPDWSVFDGTDLEVDMSKFFEEDGKILGLGSSTSAIVYNRDLISEDDLPRSLYECADPKYRGQFIMDVRPIHTFAMFFELYGEEATAEWARAIVENEPLWGRNAGPINTALLQGERLFVCGSTLHGVLRDFVQPGPDGTFIEDPNVPLAAIPPADAFHGAARVRIMMAEYPNAPNTALLWFAYVANHPGFEDINPGYAEAVPGSWKAAWFERYDAPIHQTPGGRWNEVVLGPATSNLVVDTWGNPTPVVE